MSRSTPRDLLLLTLLCGLTYFTGLTTQGLANWQEAQRAQVAREMQQRGDWIVPRESGRPYLNKPPAVYWAQLAIASLRGGRTTEFDLRLTVALGGWLGVIATYLVTRRLMSPVDPGVPADESLPWAGDTAWWSSLFLATGLLYVRSSRIGELDILLIAPTVVVIGAVHAAWRSHLLGRRTNWAAIALASLAACAAMLVKGPPGLLVAALASYGGILLWAGLQAGRGAPAEGPVEPRRVPRAARLAAAAGAASLAVTASVLSEEPLRSLDGLTGLCAFALIGAVLGAAGAQVVRGRLGVLFVAYSRTHPLLVLGAPLAALAAWFWLVSERLGGWGAVRGTISGEAGDNVRPLVLASPLNNLEAASYGAGLGSLAAVIACFWLYRRRPALPAGWWLVTAWVLLGLAALSLFGKGVPRYLTPVWPGIAIVGGAWASWKLRNMSRPGVLRGPLIAAVLALAAGQAWWYGRARAHPPVWLERIAGPLPSPSPRELVAALLELPGVDRARLGTFEFDTAQVDYYAGVRVPGLVDAPPRPGIAMVAPADITDLAARVEREREPFTLLVRRTQPPSMDPALATQRLSAFFRVEPLPPLPRFTIDNGRTEVIAVRVFPKQSP